MTKFYYLIILLITFNSCTSNKKDEDKILDEEFKICKDLELSERMKNTFHPIRKTKIDSVKRIYPLFEKFLLDKKILKDVNKKGYKDLLEMSFNKKITSKNIFEFCEFMQIDVIQIFSPNSMKRCFASTEFRYNQMKKEKKGWQYEFCLMIDKYEFEGGFNENGLETLKKSIDIIPDQKFEMEIYRRYILALIVNIGYNNEI